MGANNALRVYQAWGRGTHDRPALKDRPLRILTYMALVSIDGAAEPWFGQGHEVLAAMALGLDYPKKDIDPAGYDAVMRKVRRAVTPLKRARAIRTTRRSTFGDRGPTHAIYRLYLDGPGPAELDGYTAD